MKIWLEEDWLLRFRSIGAISSMIKGNNLVMKRDFIENNGFSLLMKYFTECAKEEDPLNDK